MYLLYTVPVSATVAAARLSRARVLTDLPGATGVHEVTECAIVYNLAAGCCVTGKAHAW